MVNFYRRFLPSVAKYQASLNGTLSGLREAQPVTWTSELDTAFAKCKEALSEVTLLSHPAPNVPLGLLMDASAHHVEAALMQLVHANWKPLAFFNPPHFCSITVVSLLQRTFCHLQQCFSNCGARIPGGVRNKPTR
ncbi:hypothetical protein TNCV_3671601 [Trichonephila clavipes]|nr:hypothetical protein TNCV_3671601 [Trichonephila clavipes]